jgi:hypothetical protein
MYVNKYALVATKPFGIEQTSGTVVLESGVGKLVVRDVVSPSRSQALYFVDDEGNEQELIGASGDVMQPEYVYWDAKRNTVVGQYPNGKAVYTTNSIFDSTVLGYGAMSGITTGDRNTVIGSQAGKNITTGSNNIFIGYKAGELTNNGSNKFELGNGSGQTLAYGQIPTSITQGFIDVYNSLGVVNKSPSGDFLRFGLTEVGRASIIKGQSVSGTSKTSLFFTFITQNTNYDLLELNSSGTFSRSATFNTTRPYARLNGDLNLLGRINFHDGTSLESVSGIAYEQGSGIKFEYIPASGKTKISVDFLEFPLEGSLNINSNLAVETSGEHRRVPVSQLMQFVNHTNPQTFFTCPGGYNLVLSNDTAVDHDKNCNSVFSGREAGNGAEGFTNSVLIGTQAGEDAFMNNALLDIDTAAVFLGYNAGRKSTNADNSIFIGPSAGQHSVGADNSIFIGNSAGQSSKSSKSIGIGDNTLESVIGENNIEIVANEADENKLINGVASNKLNIGGIVAGDTCIGRVSVGGAARIDPSAALEVSAKFGDDDVRLQEWFNSDGDLVAYLDQGGNLVLRGTVVQSTYNLGSTNLQPATNIPVGLECGNTNISGNAHPVNIDCGCEVEEGEPAYGYSEGVTPEPGTFDGYMLSYTTIYSEE